MSFVPLVSRFFSLSALWFPCYSCVHLWTVIFPICSSHSCSASFLEICLFYFLWSHTDSAEPITSSLEVQVYKKVPVKPRGKTSECRIKFLIGKSYCLIFTNIFCLIQHLYQLLKNGLYACVKKICLSKIITKSFSFFFPESVFSKLLVSVELLHRVWISWVHIELALQCCWCK